MGAALCVMASSCFGYYRPPHYEDCIGRYDRRYVEPIGLYGPYDGFGLYPYPWMPVGAAPLMSYSLCGSESV
jgi:hypothetical protein